VAAVAVLVIGATLKNGISIVLAFLTLGPFFERFFILGGPRGTRQKKLQNLDPMQPKAGPRGGIIAHQFIN
jgi:hypothetical protein